MHDDPSSLIHRSREARRNGNGALALQLARQAEAAGLASDDIGGRSAAAAMIGQLQRDDGRLDDAIRSYEGAVRLAREAKDQPLLAHHLRHLGDIAVERGELERAEDCYAEAGTLMEANGTSRLNKANSLRSVAILREKQGASAAAADLWSEVRTIYAAEGIEDGVRESDRRLAALGQPPN